MEFKNSSTSFEESHSDNESEWSESSKPKYKRIKKHFKRRMESKILHTICIKYTKPNGQIQFIKHTKLIGSLEQDKNALDKEIENLAKNHSDEIMKNYFVKLEPVEQPQEQLIDYSSTIRMLDVMNFYFQSMVYTGMN